MALVDFRRGNRVQNAVEQLRCTGALGGGLCEANYYPEKYSPVYLAEVATTAPGSSMIDQYWQDGGFAKLRSVSATYTIPERFTGGASRASLTLAARELHTWTKYKGVDPEVNANNPATSAATHGSSAHSAAHAADRDLQHQVVSHAKPIFEN